MNELFSVAIDGPSGAGKSTVAKLCAERLGFLYVDTGAIYRTVGLAAKMSGVASKDFNALAALLPSIEINMRHDENGLQRMILNGNDVTDKIRMPDISVYASDVSAIPAVRAFLLDMQRGLAHTNRVIMDGRDIGTVVLPDADLKIFLTAKAEERAQRRYDELILKGVKTTFEDVLKNIHYRDGNDSSREVAPLKLAADAHFIDTTGNTLEESFAIICGLIEEKLPK